MSLFVLSSKDGWVNIMYDGLDAVGVDQQVTQSNFPAESFGISSHRQLLKVLGRAPMRDGGVTPPKRTGDPLHISQGASLAGPAPQIISRHSAQQKLFYC